MKRMTRRTFLKGSTYGLGLAGLNGSLAWSARRSKGQGQQKTLVYLFFRGGMDCLNLMMPISGIHRVNYEDKRPNIQIPISGNNAALPLNNEFGIHPACSHLYNMYQDGNLAMVHACGMPSGSGSRSHFDSQEMFEMGTTGSTPVLSGWLARHLETSTTLSDTAIFPTLTPGVTPMSLTGSNLSVAVDDPNNFHPNSGRYGNEFIDHLRDLYDGNDALDQTVRTAVQTVEQLETSNLDIPSFYPSNNRLADDLGLIAQVIKGNYGLEVATVDFGGWDTHQNQGNNGGGYFYDQMEDVSSAIEAFFTDLNNSGLMDDVVLITQTDFGRRAAENGNQGTDHGTGQVMMAIGGSVQGGQVLGHFPGMSTPELFQGADLNVTMDYRAVLSDALVNFMENPFYQVVFPGYSGTDSIGLFPSEKIFKDEFESL